MNPKNPLSNASGYPDPTAYYGMQPVVQQEAKQMQTISSLIHCIKTMTDFAGFEVIHCLLEPLGLGGVGDVEGDDIHRSRSALPTLLAKF